jgi:hypothetical protein
MVCFLQGWFFFMHYSLGYVYFAMYTKCESFAFVYVGI